MAMAVLRPSPRLPPVTMAILSMCDLGVGGWESGTSLGNEPSRPTWRNRRNSCPILQPPWAGAHGPPILTLSQPTPAAAMTIQLKQALTRHIEGLGGGDG